MLVHCSPTPADLDIGVEDAVTIDFNLCTSLLPQHDDASILDMSKNLFMSDARMDTMDPLAMATLDLGGPSTDGVFPVLDIGGPTLVDQEDDEDTQSLENVEITLTPPIQHTSTMNNTTLPSATQTDTSLPITTLAAMSSAIPSTSTPALSLPPTAATPTPTASSRPQATPKKITITLPRRRESITTPTVALTPAPEPEYPPPPPPFVPNPNSNVRQCTFCGTEKTPMWRHGPTGYDPLCNGCGVKWKRGRILKGFEKRKRSASSSPRPSHSHLASHGHSTTTSPKAAPSVVDWNAGSAEEAAKSVPALPPVQLTTATGRPARAKANPNFSYPYAAPHRSASDTMLLDSLGQFAKPVGVAGGCRRKRNLSSSYEYVMDSPTLSCVSRDFHVTLQMATSNPSTSPHLDGPRLEDLVATCRKHHLLPPPDPDRPLEPRTLIGSGPRAAFLASALALIPAKELAFVAAGLGKIIQGRSGKCGVVTAMTVMATTGHGDVAKRGEGAHPPAPGAISNLPSHIDTGSQASGVSTTASKTLPVSIKANSTGEGTLPSPALEFEWDVGELSMGEWGNVCGFLFGVGA
ncbi:hypothetical protein HDU97_002398 [Phlyctochytrium planicorne]|nr:hypothetical protein HDU97_002398 [Phlyctochytrium planicorne]